MGKGLRSLLNGIAVPGRAEGHPAASENPVQPPNAGLSALLSGERGLSTPSPKESSPEAAGFKSLWQNWAVMKWILVAADVLLLSLASLLVFKHPGRLSFLEWVLCLLALSTGAALAAWALLGHAPGRPSASNPPEE